MRNTFCHQQVLDAFETALLNVDIESLKESLSGSDEAVLTPIFERLETQLGRQTQDRLADFLASPADYLNEQLDNYPPIEKSDFTDQLAESMTLPDGVETVEWFWLSAHPFREVCSKENCEKLGAINNYRNKQRRRLIDRHQLLVKLALAFINYNSQFDEYLRDRIKQRLLAMLENNFEAGDSGKLWGERSRYAESYHAPLASDCIELLLNTLPVPGTKEFFIDIFTGVYQKTLKQKTDSSSRTRQVNSYNCLFPHLYTTIFDTFSEYLYDEGEFTEDLFLQVAQKWPRCIRGHLLYGRTNRSIEGENQDYISAYRQHLYATAEHFSEDLPRYFQQFNTIFNYRFQGINWVQAALAHIRKHNMSHDAITACLADRILDELPAALHRLLGITSLRDEDTEEHISQVLSTYTIEELRTVVFYTGVAKEYVMKACEWEQFIPVSRYIESIEENSQPRGLNGVVDLDELYKISGNVDETSLDEFLSLYQHSYKASKDSTELVKAALNLDRKKVEKRLVRHAQNAIRAYGLYPSDDAEELKARYLTFKKMYKEARKYGAERQHNTHRAIQTGLTYLAKIAGFADAEQMEWSLEAALADNARQLCEWQPVHDWQIRLHIQGTDPRISIRRDDKPLKSVPAKVRQSDLYKTLREAQEQMRDQARRYSRTFENAMVRMDRWRAPELSDIARLPVVAELFSQLLVRSNNGDIGLYNPQEKTLTDYNGKQLPPGDEWQIAHPVHLFEANQVSEWQQYIYSKKIVQPFKQAYRELYIVTPAEIFAECRSARFAGHVVYADMAAKLLQGRDWQFSASDTDEGGHAYRHFANGLQAVVEFPDVQYTFMQEPTRIGDIFFVKDKKTLQLSHIDPVIFSEVMRDIDLVAAVAMYVADHSSNENTTIFDKDRKLSKEIAESRIAIVTQIVNEIGIKNIDFDERYVHVRGKLANYDVNMASGTIYKAPEKRYICIIPDDEKKKSKNEGSIYLPYADTDLKVREIISKILLLSNDDKIEDKLIMQQIDAS